MWFNREKTELKKEIERLRKEVDELNDVLRRERSSNDATRDTCLRLQRQIDDIIMWPYIPERKSTLDKENKTE